MKELWKDIEGYKGFYQISNLGKVRSMNRIIVRSDGLKMNFKGKSLSEATDSIGYSFVVLSSNLTSKSFMVHRLVASSFVDNPDSLPEVNHKNGIKTDNRVENLEWTTHSQNVKHAYETGLLISKKGIDHHLSKLNDNQVIKIRALYKSGEYSQRELAKRFGVTQTLISQIVIGKIWKHLIMAS